MKMSWKGGKEGMMEDERTRTDQTNRNEEERIMLQVKECFILRIMF